jgi:hypothetical protein
MTRKKFKVKINLNKRLVFLLAKEQNPKPKTHEIHSWEKEVFLFSGLDISHRIGFSSKGPVFY